ncbi:MAG: hypothetical protein H7A35_12220 [Planctomycetales bacterium]|nr:hypothetical protein [bacterium]UNM07620.1 MAG: hypothetical protein H7A35_12220 [Planctomycetales bacterium]
MNRLLLPAGLLALLVMQPAVSVAQHEAGDDDVLRIRSNGRTRIEIHEGNQVAVYTGGVQFEYQDYRLSADSLRYSQADSFAEATGNVHLEQTGSRLDTQRVEIYIDENLLRCPGEISGMLSEQGLAFNAESGTVKLTGQPGDEQSTYRIELRDKVQVFSREGYQFTTSIVTMDTDSGLVNVPQPFSLLLPVADDARSGPSATPVMMSDLVLNGASMTGQLDERNQLSSLHALATEIKGEQLNFSAGSVNAKFLDNGHDGTMIDLLATGSPVRGSLRQPKQDLSFSADTISGTIDPGYGSQFLLSGGIDLSADMALLKSDLLSIVQDQQGVRIVFPEGLEAGMALDVISGNEGLDLSEILHK